MRFLDDAEVLRIADRPECRRARRTQDFARAALADRHRCLAIRDGDFVAHFRWYSRKSPTRINDAWTMHFGAFTSISSIRTHDTEARSYCPSR